MEEKSLTVVIVEDDESVRKALKRLLWSNGYPVVAFESAEDLLQSHWPDGEVCLVLDICLPGMSGFDLHEKLVSTGLKLPVVFMTAADNPNWLEWGEKSVGVDFLLKPFDVKSLLDAVHRACCKWY